MPDNVQFYIWFRMVYIACINYYYYYYYYYYVVVVVVVSGKKIQTEIIKIKHIYSIPFKISDYLNCNPFNLN